MEKENEEVKRNLCLLRNVFVDGQAESRYFWFLCPSLKERGENGSQRKWGCLLLEASLVIFVLRRACDRESQDTEEGVGRKPVSPFSPIHHLCLASLIR